MNQTPPAYDGGPISTIIDKLNDKQRAKLDQAIIKRDPSSLRAIHEKFDLAAEGISYQTLYRYSRHVLEDHARTTLLDSSFTEDVDIPTAMMKIIGRNSLLELLQGEASALDHHRFVLAFQKSLLAVKTLLEIRKLQAGDSNDNQPMPAHEYHETVRRALVDAFGDDIYPPTDDQPAILSVNNARSVAACVPAGRGSCETSDLPVSPVAACAPAGRGTGEISNAPGPQASTPKPAPNPQSKIRNPKSQIHIPKLWGASEKPRLTARQQHEFDLVAAPWGRDKDGNPRTQREYNRTLAPKLAEARGDDFYPDYEPVAYAKHCRDKLHIQRRVAEQQRDAALKRLGLSETVKSRAHWLSLLDPVTLNQPPADQSPEPAPQLNVKPSVLEPMPILTTWHPREEPDDPDRCDDTRRRDQNRDRLRPGQAPKPAEVNRKPKSSFKDIDDDDDDDRPIVTRIPATET